MYIERRFEGSMEGYLISFDLGKENFITLSCGSEIENSRFINRI